MDELDNAKGRLIITHGKFLSVANVADIFGVEISEIEQAVKDNPHKFPDGYIFEFSEEEKKEYIEKLIRDNSNFKPEFPVLFPQKGMYMLATLLKGRKAKEATIEIIEAFAKVRDVAEKTNSMFKIP